MFIGSQRIDSTPPPQPALPPRREHDYSPLEVQIIAGSSLSAESLQGTAKELLGTYARGFLHSQDAVAKRADEFLADLVEHLRSSERIAIARQGEHRAVLCGSVRESPLGRIFHLGGILVDPALQRQGVALDLLRNELIESKAIILTFHTQTENMVKLGNRCAEISLRLSQAVSPYLEDLHRNLDPQSCIDHQRYGGQPLYGDLEALRKFRIPGINISRGDARFFAGLVKLSNEGGIA